MPDQNIAEWLLEGQHIITPKNKVYEPCVLVDTLNKKIIKGPYLRPKNSSIKLRTDLKNKGLNFHDTETWRLEGQIVETFENKKYEAYILVDSNTKEIIKGPYLSEINNFQKKSDGKIFDEITRLDMEIKEMISNYKQNFNEQLQAIEK